MTLESWIAFAITSIALLAMPGPTVILVVSYAFSNGKQSAWSTVPGATLGDATAMTLSLFGAGAVLATSHGLFAVFKIIGAGLLVWLGMQRWKSQPLSIERLNKHAGDSRQKMFWSLYAVTALHPGGYVFFIAFVPQFVDSAQPIFRQFLILELTFLALTAANVLIWVWIADLFRMRLKSDSFLRLVNHVGGSLLIGAGFVTAITQLSVIIAGDASSSP